MLTQLRQLLFRRRVAAVREWLRRQPGGGPNAYEVDAYIRSRWRWSQLTEDERRAVIRAATKES